MRTSGVFGFFILVSVLGLSIVVSGCSKGGKKKQENQTENEKGDGEGGSDKRVAVKAASFKGVVKGRVVYERKPPTEKVIPALIAHENCKDPKTPEFQKVKQEWMVDAKSMGVKNVVVFLKPPQGKYFDLPKELRERKDKAEMIQPHCAFIPHVLACFPVYPVGDGSEWKATGQKVDVHNNAPFNHNTKVKGESLAGNKEQNRTLTPSETLTLDLKPQNTPVNVSCDIHTWMSAKIWVFEHPFYAVTDDQGNFEIKNAPTGIPVTFTAWHEAKQEFKTETLTLKDGEKSMGELKISQ